MYFPGNVRSFASILKQANTAGQGIFNPFFLFINRDNLNDKPYNYRFDVMGIDSRVFVHNLGFQITIILAMCVVGFILKYIRSRCYTDERRRPIEPKGVFGKLYKIVAGSFDFNAIVRLVVMLSMFSFLSSVITIVNLKFDNLDQVLSFI